MTNGRSPIIHGDGTQSRDFTFVADVVQANLLAAEAPGVSGQVYNIACGRRTSLLELVGQLNTLLGTDIKPDAHRCASRRRAAQPGGIDEARNDLKYEPTTDIVTGLRHCLEWWRQRQPATGRQPQTV